MGLWMRLMSTTSSLLPLLVVQLYCQQVEQLLHPRQRSRCECFLLRMGLSLELKLWQLRSHDIISHTIAKGTLATPPTRSPSVSRWSLSSDSNAPTPVIQNSFRNSFLPPNNLSRTPNRISRQAAAPSSPASSRSTKSFGRGILRLGSSKPKRTVIKKSKITIVGAQRVASGRYTAMMKTAELAATIRIESPASVSHSGKPGSRGSRGSSNPTPTLGSQRRGSSVHRNGKESRRSSATSERRGSASSTVASSSRKGGAVKSTTSVKSQEGGKELSSAFLMETNTSDIKRVRPIFVPPSSPPLSLDRPSAREDDGPWIDLDTPPPTPSKSEHKRSTSMEALRTFVAASPELTCADANTSLFIPTPDPVSLPSRHRRASSLARLSTGHPGNYHARFRDKFSALPATPPYSDSPGSSRQSSITHASLGEMSRRESTDATLSRELRSFSEPAQNLHIPLRAVRSGLSSFRPSFDLPHPTINLKVFAEEREREDELSSDIRRSSAPDEPTTGFRTQSRADALERRRKSAQAALSRSDESRSSLRRGSVLSSVLSSQGHDAFGTSPGDQGSLFSHRLSFPRSVSFASPTQSPVCAPRQRTGSEISLYSLSVNHDNDTNLLLSTPSSFCSNHDTLPAPATSVPVSSLQWEGYSLHKVVRQTTPPSEIAPETTFEAHQRDTSASLWSRPLPSVPLPQTFQEDPRRYSFESQTSSPVSTPTSSSFGSLELPHNVATITTKSSLYQAPQPNVIKVEFINHGKTTYRRPSLSYATLEEDFNRGTTRGRWSFLKDERQFSLEEDT